MYMLFTPTFMRGMSLKFEGTQDDLTVFSLFIDNTSGHSTHPCLTTTLEK